MSPSRRLALLFGLGQACGWRPAAAQQRRPVDAPLRVGFERALVEAGFADAVRRGLASDTGLRVDPEAGPSSALLQALEQGDLDAAVTHAPAMEAQLEAAGLTHDLRPVAVGDFVLVGPGGRRRDTASISGTHDAAAALAAIARAGAPFLSAADGSGTHLAEQALWRAATVAPQGPWYLSLPADGLPLLEVAGEAQAYALVDRSRWLARPARNLGLMVQGDPRLATTFQVQRPFRGRHPAAKLFVAWLAGPRGRHTVGGFGRGLRLPA